MLWGYQTDEDNTLDLECCNICVVRTRADNHTQYKYVLGRPASSIGVVGQDFQLMTVKRGNTVTCKRKTQQPSDG